MGMCNICVYVGECVIKNKKGLRVQMESEVIFSLIIMRIYNDPVRTSDLSTQPSPRARHIYSMSS